jgi:hypothetical protein
MSYPCPAKCVNNYSQDARKKTPNLPFLGNEPAFVIPNATTNLTTLCWDLRADETIKCCPPQAGTMELTPDGGTSYSITSGSELNGCFEFPLQLTDAQDIVMTYLDCEGDLQTITAGTNFIGFNCEPQVVTFPDVCTNYYLRSCPICKCDCNIPFNISVDLGQGPVVIGIINRDGNFVVTNNAYKDKNGVFVRGYYESSDNACNGMAFIYIGIEPGLPLTAVVTATIDGQTYTFACTESCEDPTDIAGVCQDGGTGGGGGTTDVTITGINGITVTEGPANTFVVDGNPIVTVNNNQQIQINNNTTDIVQNTTDITAIQNELLADQDFQQAYLIANWVPSGPNFILTVAHNLNTPVGIQPVFHVIETATGAVVTYQVAFPNVNTLVLTTTPGGQKDVTVTVEYYETNNPL